MLRVIIYYCVSLFNFVRRQVQTVPGSVWRHQLIWVTIDLVPFSAASSSQPRENLIFGEIFPRRLRTVAWDDVQTYTVQNIECGGKNKRGQQALYKLLSNKAKNRLICRMKFCNILLLSVFPSITLMLRVLWWTLYMIFVQRMRPGNLFFQSVLSLWKRDILQDLALQNVQCLLAPSKVWSHIVSVVEQGGALLGVTCGCCVSSSCRDDIMFQTWIAKTSGLSWFRCTPIFCTFLIWYIPVYDIAMARK